MLSQLDLVCSEGSILLLFGKQLRLLLLTLQAY